MSNAKRHHFLPRKYQVGFAEPNGPVWYFDRRRGVIASGNPLNVAVERHFYTSETPGSSNPTAMETFLAEHVEGPFWPVLERLERQETPTAGDRSRISIFAGFLLTRVPAFRDFCADVLNDTLISHSNLRSVILSLDGLFAKTDSGFFVPKAPKNNALHQMGKLGIEVAQHLDTLDTHLMYSTASEPFITTDNPFVLDRILNDGQAPTVSATSFLKWIPLSAKVAVGFGLPGNTIYFTNVEPTNARKANLRLATAARQMILARSREQLQQILADMPKETPMGAADFPSVVF